MSTSDVLATQQLPLTRRCALDNGMTQFIACFEQVRLSTSCALRSDVLQRFANSGAVQYEVTTCNAVKASMAAAPQYRR